MSYQLQRGQNVSLTRLAASVQRVAVGLGWDAQVKGGADFNLDASAFLLTENGKVPSDEYFIFFNNLTSPDGSVQHQGNNTTGIGEGDDETININLAKVPPQIQKIVFTVTIYEPEARRQNFGMMKNAFIRVVNLADKQEIARYNLTEKFGAETAMVFGELYRHKDEWKFRAVGQGFAGGLQAMTNSFGVSTDEEESCEVANGRMGETANEQLADSQPRNLAISQPRNLADSPIRNLAISQPRPVSAIKVGVTGLRYELLYPDAYSMLKVYLENGQSIKAESDAMISMSSTVSVEGKLEGGIFGGIGRMLAGENFFFQTLSAKRGPGEVLLAQAMPGDIQAIELNGSQSYVVQKDGFLAGTPDLQISTKMQNLMDGLFSGEGFFILKVSGRGTLFVSSYGAIHPIDIPSGQDFIIDNNHLVAWPDGMNFQMQKASSGWISSFTSGEMLVCRFRGPGRVLIQTRNTVGFAEWVKQFLPLPANAATSTTSSAASTASNVADAANAIGRLLR